MTTAYGGPARFALLAVIAIGLAFAPVARAETRGEAEKKPQPPPKRVWVQLFAAKSLPEPLRITLEEAVASGANQAGGLKYATEGSGEPDLHEIETTLEASDKALAKAEELVQDLDFDGAIEHLMAAAKGYALYLPDLLVRDGNASKLIDTYVQTAIVQFLNDDEEEASKALARCFVLNLKLEYDSKVFPPQSEEFVVQELLLFDELGKGTLEVTVEGGAATVYINGMEQGEAPVVVQELPAGPNFVNLAVPGGDPIALIGMVEGEGKVKVKHKLEHAPSRVTGPLAKARSHVGKKRATSRLKKAARELKVDGLLLVAPKVKGESVQLVAYLYDMRTGKLVSRAATEVELVGGEAEARELGQSVVGGAVWEIEVKRRKPKGPSFWTRMQRNKFWKHKYFWPAVGVAAGVVVVGVVATAASGGLSPGQKVGLFPVVRF